MHVDRSITKQINVGEMVLNCKASLMERNEMRNAVQRFNDLNLVTKMGKCEELTEEEWNLVFKVTKTFNSYSKKQK